jgi:hypothetical protein
MMEEQQASDALRFASDEIYHGQGERGLAVDGELFQLTGGNARP